MPSGNQSTQIDNYPFYSGMPSLPSTCGPLIKTGDEPQTPKMTDRLDINELYGSALMKRNDARMQDLAETEVATFDFHRMKGATAAELKFQGHGKVNLDPRILEKSSEVRGSAFVRLKVR